MLSVIILAHNVQAQTPALNVLTDIFLLNKINFLNTVAVNNAGLIVTNA